MAWKRLPGTAKRYENTETGQVLPYRQYRKLRLRGELPGAAPVKHVGRNTKYEAVLRDWMDIQAEKGNKYKKSDAMRNPELKRIVKDLRSKKADVRKQAVIDLGRRQNIPAWVPLGESPKYQEAVSRGRRKSFYNRVHRRKGAAGRK